VHVFAEQVNATERNAPAHRDGAQRKSPDKKLGPVRAWLPVQPKLTVNEPGDRYEQEADQVADQVMSTSGDGRIPRVSRVDSVASMAQRKCTQCEEEEHKDGKGGESEGEIDGHTAQGIRAMQGRGSPLPEATRSFFAPRFGHDFANVRIHADSRAADAARSIQARAFTFGQNIAFGAGEYAPESQAGRRLLAHELTHTLQQGDEVRRVQRLTITQYNLTKGTCGERNVQWVFSLDKKAPADGYIVQHIERGRAAETCPKAAGTPKVDLSFWEAWFLKKDDKVDWTTTRDKWTDGNTRPPSPNTSGRDFARGEVKFFKKSTTGDLGDFGVAPADPKSAWGPGKVSASGDLPSTPSEPSWWSGTPDEGPAKRSVEATWNCCDADSAKHTYDLVALPKPAGP